MDLGTIFLAMTSDNINKYDIKKCNLNRDISDCIPDIPVGNEYYYAINKWPVKANPYSDTIPGVIVVIKLEKTDTPEIVRKILASPTVQMAANTYISNLNKKKPQEPLYDATTGEKLRIFDSETGEKLDPDQEDIYTRHVIAEINGIRNRENLKHEHWSKSVSKPKSKPRPPLSWSDGGGKSHKKSKKHNLKKHKSKRHKSNRRKYKKRKTRRHNKSKY